MLSDKTGTLTQNLMKLRRCSIGEYIFGAPLIAPNSEVNMQNEGSHVSNPITISIARDPIKDMTIRQVNENQQELEAEAESDWLPLGSIEQLLPRASTPSTASILPSSRFQLNQISPIDFFRNLAVCNTVMLMPDVRTGFLNVTDLKSLESCLEAESPDEVALVLAAAEHANVLLVRYVLTHTLTLTLTHSLTHALTHSCTHALLIFSSSGAD